MNTQWPSGALCLTASQKMIASVAHHTSLAPAAIETRKVVKAPVEVHRYAWPTVRELTAEDIAQQRRLVSQSLLDTAVGPANTG